MSNGVASYALLFLLAMIFGSNFMMTKIAVAEIEPLTIVSGRLVIAMVVLLAVMFLAGTAWPTGAVWWPLALTAVFGHALPYFLITWSQEVIDAGLAAIFMAVMPLFTILVAHFVTDDEKLNRFVIAGFALAFCGVVLLFGTDRLGSFDGTSLRQYALLAAALCYGINALLTKKLTGLPWQSMAAGQLVAAVTITVPLALFIGGINFVPKHASAPALMSLLYTGIVPTALGAIMIFIIVGRAGASFLSQINFLVPLVGVAMSIAFLGETLPPNGFVALAAILMGVAIARWRPNRKTISINKGV